tara:strand:+ start:271 stop:660 length:390 start_codon:yes stop_codon:yes gene_type:complete
MSDIFTVEIISPDKTILKSEATEVTIPSYEGEMGILKDHIPLITFLRPGVIIVKKSDKEEKIFIEEGTVEFSENVLLILTSTAKNLKDFSKNEISELIQNSIEFLKKDETNDKEKYFLSHKVDSLREIN